MKIEAFHDWNISMHRKALEKPLTWLEGDRVQVSLHSAKVIVALTASF
jgi:hypothetical protein